MKQIIKDVLDDMSTTQVNLGSDAARDTISNLISAALKTKGTYTEYDDSEIEEQEARETWVCEICGENTFEVDYDYLGSGTNHLGCELEKQPKVKDLINEYIDACEPTGDDVAKALGHMDKDGEYIEDIIERGKDRRKKNWLQKKHENKVFGGDTGTDADFGHETDDSDIPEGLKRAKELSQEALEEGLKRQLSEEIVDDKDEKYIYESPDGGKTIYKRKFGETERELHKENTDEG